MIKGVNKRIIEINNPESIYFEKAIFYLKPGVRELPMPVTETEIQKYIGRLGIEDYGTRKKSRLKWLVLALIVLISAVGIFLAFTN